MKSIGFILILLELHSSTGEHAHCPRFYYEEQTLAKIVRMEYRLEELEKRRTADLTNALCPDGWITFQGSCYMFSQDKVNFFDAEILCSRAGGHLVHVESELENYFLKQNLTQLKDAHYWMGLNDLDQDGTFKWYGTNGVASFTDWCPNEPSNKDGIEQCVHFHSGRNYSWNDNQCKTLMKAVCELKLK